MADRDGFQGFPEWGVRFYQDLEETNSKEFWSEHRVQWERSVRDPMRALVEELEDEFGPGKLFRPHRDIRFSHDKSPYKTHQGALVGSAKAVGYYVQVSGDGLTVGGGFHAHSPGQTDRFRAAIDADESGAAVVQIAADLVGAGYLLEGAALKTRPKGYPTEHPRIDLLRRKEIMAIRRVGSPPWLSTPRALEEVRSAWRDVRPLTHWVLEHVGAE